MVDQQQDDHGGCPAGGGVQSMILGVLGEYVGRTFLTANGKPQGAVRMVERNGEAGV